MEESFWRKNFILLIGGLLGGLILSQVLQEVAPSASFEFGEERLLAAVTRHNGESARRIIEAVCAEVTAFTGDTPQHDDMTMVVVKIV